MNVRCYVPGEYLPEKLRTGFEKGEGTSPRWIFIAERDGKKVGILVTSPAHLFVIFIRLVMTEEAKYMDTRNLLVNVAQICKARGFKGYVTWVDPTITVERDLATLIRTAGGKQLTNPQVACTGRF